MKLSKQQLEQAYDKLEDQYWDLVKFIFEYSPELLKEFTHRNKPEGVNHD